MPNLSCINFFSGRIQLFCVSISAFTILFSCNLPFTGADGEAQGLKGPPPSDQKTLKPEPVHTRNLAHPDYFTESDLNPNAPWLGLYVSDISETGFPLPTDQGDVAHGVRILQVYENFSADSAGIAQGDILIEFNGSTLTSKSQYALLKDSTETGQLVHIQYIHEGAIMEADVRMMGTPYDSDILKRPLLGQRALLIQGMYAQTADTSCVDCVRLLMFFSTLCSHCRLDMPLVQELYGLYQGYPFTVTAVSMQDSPIVNAYIAADGLTFSVISNSSISTFLDFRVYATPTYYLVDAQGSIIDYWVGSGSVPSIEEAMMPLSVVRQ